MSNRGKTLCTGSERVLTAVPGADHWHATCPDCGKGFLLPQYRLPRHFRCEHKDVSRPTSADPNYRCNVCQELLCEAFEGDVPAEPTPAPAPRRGCAFAVRQVSLSASWEERQAGWCQAEALPNDDYCATHAEQREAGALYRGRARNPRATFNY